MIGIDKNTAIQSLVPNAEVVISDGVVVWINPSTAPVSDEQIAQELTRLEQQYATDAYKRNRLAEYPPIGDQLDALWKGGDAAAEMLTKVQAVKVKYPKGA